MAEKVAAPRIHLPVRLESPAKPSLTPALTASATAFTAPTAADATAAHSRHHLTT